MVDTANLCSAAKALVEIEKSRISTCATMVFCQHGNLNNSYIKELFTDTIHPGETVNRRSNILHPPLPPRKESEEVSISTFSDNNA